MVSQQPPPTPAAAHRPLETMMLNRLQRALDQPPVITGARWLSRFGEHGAGWIVLGIAGAVADRNRRRDWLIATTGVIGAHALSVAIKRIVRLPRPPDGVVCVRARTPGRLSFPSSHCASTTAAAVLLSGLTTRLLIPVLVPPMLISRLVLGVHYPSDVLAGCALGAVLGDVLRRRQRGFQPG